MWCGNLLHWITEIFAILIFLKLQRGYVMFPFQTHTINRNSSLVESDTISKHQIIGNAVVSSCAYTACCTDVVFRIPFQSPSSICCSQECGRLPVPGEKDHRHRKYSTICSPIWDWPDGCSYTFPYSFGKISGELIPIFLL